MMVGFFRPSLCLRCRRAFSEAHFAPRTSQLSDKSARGWRFRIVICVVYYTLYKFAFYSVVRMGCCLVSLSNERVRYVTFTNEWENRGSSSIVSTLVCVVCCKHAIIYNMYNTCVGMFIHRVKLLA